MEFDLNLLRVAVTLLSFAVFLAIMVWACDSRNRAGFEEAAALPFAEDGGLPSSGHPQPPSAGARHE